MLYLYMFIFLCRYSLQNTFPQTNKIFTKFSAILKKLKVDFPRTPGKIFSFSYFFKRESGPGKDIAPASEQLIEIMINLSSKSRIHHI